MRKICAKFSLSLLFALLIFYYLSLFYSFRSTSKKSTIQNALNIKNCLKSKRAAVRKSCQIVHPVRKLDIQLSLRGIH